MARSPEGHHLAPAELALERAEALLAGDASHLTLAAFLVALVRTSHEEQGTREIDADVLQGLVQGAPRARRAPWSQPGGRNPKPRPAFAAKAPKTNMRATRKGACASLRILVAH